MSRRRPATAMRTRAGTAHGARGSAGGSSRRRCPTARVVESFFYQKHGRAGRLSERTIYDASGHPLAHLWRYGNCPNPADVTGGWSGAPSGRIKTRWTRNEYGNTVGASVGAVQQETFEYDDDYGYNFAKQVHTVRPSTDTIRFLEPATANTNDWIVGSRARAARRGSARLGLDEPLGPSLHARRRLAKERRQRWRGDVTAARRGPDPVLLRRLRNLRQRIDANGHSTGFGYDATGSVLTSRTDPAVGGQPGRTTIFTPHPVFGVPFAVDPGYRDVPRVQLDTRCVRPRDRDLADPARQSGRRRARPRLRNELHRRCFASVCRAARLHDGRRRHSHRGGRRRLRRRLEDDPRRRHGVPAARVDLATWDRPRVHDPAQRLVAHDRRSACGTDPWCTAHAAGPVARDASRSPMRSGGRSPVVDTARGTSLFHYAASREPIAQGDTRKLAPGRCRLVPEREGRSHAALVRRRSRSGGRGVHELRRRTARASRTQPCASTDGPNRTLYGYHASGQLQVIHDPIGAGVQWGNPHHQLRYHFDTAGFVIAIDDPDAGPQPDLLRRGRQRGRNGERARISCARRPTMRSTGRRRSRRPRATIAFSYRAEELQLSARIGPALHQDLHLRRLWPGGLSRACRAGASAHYELRSSGARNGDLRASSAARRRSGTSTRARSCQRICPRPTSRCSVLGRERNPRIVSERRATTGSAAARCARLAGGLRTFVSRTKTATRTQRAI